MRAISRYPDTLRNLQSYPKGLRYDDELWYLQRTEKFTYNVSEKLPEDLEGTDSCYEMRPRA